MQRRAVHSLFRSAFRLVNEVKCRPAVLNRAAIASFGDKDDGMLWDLHSTREAIRWSFRQTGDSSEQEGDLIDNAFSRLSAARRAVHLLPVDVGTRLRSIASARRSARNIQCLALVGDIVRSTYSEPYNSVSFIDSVLAQCARSCVDRVHQAVALASARADILEFCSGEARKYRNQYLDLQLKRIRSMPASMVLSLATELSALGVAAPDTDSSQDKSTKTPAIEQKGFMRPSEEELKAYEASSLAQLLLRAAETADRRATNLNASATGTCSEGLRESIEEPTLEKQCPANDQRVEADLDSSVARPPPGGILSQAVMQMLVVHAIRRETLGPDALEFCPDETMVKNIELERYLGLGGSSAGGAWLDAGRVAELRRQVKDWQDSNSNQEGHTDFSSTYPGHRYTPIVPARGDDFYHPLAVDVAGALGIRSAAAGRTSSAEASTRPPKSKPAGSQGRHRIDYTKLARSRQQDTEHLLPAVPVVAAVVAQEVGRLCGLDAGVFVVPNHALCGIQLESDADSQEPAHKGGGGYEWYPWEPCRVMLDLYASGGIEPEPALGRRLLADGASLGAVKRVFLRGPSPPSAVLDKAMHMALFRAKMYPYQLPVSYGRTSNRDPTEIGSGPRHELRMGELVYRLEIASKELRDLMYVEGLDHLDLYRQGHRAGGSSQEHTSKEPSGILL